MSLKIKLIILFVCLLFIFPSKVNAKDANKLYFLKPNSDGTEYLSHEKYFFEGNFSAVEKSFILMYNLINGEKYNYIPEGTKLLSVDVDGDHLIINVDNRLLSYGGGTYYETCLIQQILYTSFDIDGIKYVTLLIDGEPACLPEGSSIYNADRNDLIFFYKTLCYTSLQSK